MKNRFILIFTFILLICSAVTIASTLDDLKAGIIVCLPLESDGSDTAGNISTLTEVSSPVYSTGIIGNAVTINEDDYLVSDGVGNISNVLDASKSISFWTKPVSDLDNADNYISFRDYLGASDEFKIIYRTTGTSNYWVWYVAGDLKTGLFYPTVHVNNWALYSMIYNGSLGATNGMRIYVNKTLQFSNALNFQLTHDYTKFWIGENADSVGGITGQIDEVMLWEQALTLEQITYLVDNTPSCSDLLPVAPPTPQIDLQFFNKTETGGNKIIFNEGEDFFVWVNYTLTNGTALSDGECDVTLYNGINEIDSTDDNFTICTSGCDYVSFTEQYDTDTNYTAFNDTVHFNGCYEQLSVGDVTLNLSCSTGSDEVIIDSSEFSNCDIGLSKITFTTQSCLSSVNVNITLTYPQTLNKRKRIEDLAIDRYYYSHVNEYPIDVYYNSSYNVFATNHTHEYYLHGLANISANCSHANPLYPLNVTEQITIVNALPLIIDNGIRINETEYPLSSPVPYKFFNEWIFLTTIIDDDLINLTFTLVNSTAVVDTQTDTSPFQFNASAKWFRDFTGNPYNFSVWAEDNVGTTYYSINFTVIDSINPVCTGINDITKNNNTYYNWSVNCVDESFYSFNISCDDNTSFFTDGLNTNNYNYVNSTLLLKTLVCDYKYCDGHTSILLSNNIYIEKELNKFIIKTDKNKEKRNNTLEIISSKKYNLSYQKMDDRYKLKVKFDKTDDKMKEYIFYYYTSDRSHYLESDKYKGWIVDSISETWLDMNLPDDENAQVNVQKIDFNLYEIKVYTTLDNLEFESIGELNCITGTQTITVLGTQDLYTISELTLSQTLFLIVLIFLLCFMLVISIYLRVGALTLILAVIFMFLGLFIISTEYPIWVKLIGYGSVFFGLIMIAVSYSFTRRT